jgi:hypothetical protein
MPELTPDELADQNLRHLCAVTGASYSPDHSAWSPVDSSTYPGPWVRIAINQCEYYISAGLVSKVKPHAGGRQRTCYFVWQQKLPYAEVVASALLLLKNDPAIFDRWATHDGPYA